MIDPVPEFVEETPAEDGEAWMVLFGSAKPVLLEELDEGLWGQETGRYGPDWSRAMERDDRRDLPAQRLE